MNGVREALGKLALLKLELDTLKQHGHTHVEFSKDENWLKKLATVERRANRNVKTCDKTDSATADALDTLKAEMESCSLCALAASRTNLVFGVGDPDARLMFIGEAPGADEDKQGEPFVGRAGKLLTRMIEDGMGLKRCNVYIANILKCRPPGNRNPLPEETAHCEPYLKDQIRIVNPEIICALGAVAAQTLLKTKEPISRLRGRFHPYEGAELLPTFHPAYLLRNPPAKAEAWKDLQMVMNKLGLEIPGRA